MIELTWDQVRRRRLWRHSLLEPAPADRLLEVVGQVCGIHAQLMPAAELAIGVRVGLPRTGIRSALWEERRLVKTHGIRGTIHLFPAVELPLWTAALRARSARAAREEARRLDSLGLSPSQVLQLVEAIGEALDGRPLTLRELGEEVVRRTGSWAAERRNEAWISGWPTWRTALGSAAAAGLLCFGPNRGAQVTLVRPDRWIGAGPAVDPDLALGEVFTRFLRAYGPAAPGHFATWFNLPPAAARALAASMPEQLVEVGVEGARLLLPRDDAEVDVPGPARSVRLLPHFDSYLRGFHPRPQLALGHEERAAGGTGRVPVLLVDGSVAGVWERRQRGRRLEVRVEPFVRLTRELGRALEREAARVGAVLESEAELRVGPVELRPHL